MKNLSLIVVMGLIAGCSAVDSFTDTTDLVDYSNYKSIKVLQIPDGLNNPSFDDTYVPSSLEPIALNKSVVVDTSVPLVDTSMAPPSASSILIIKQGAQFALKFTNGGDALWKHSLSALKEMGMTIAKSDEATGVVHVRDRSLVSSTDNAIGQFFNKSLGRMNEGAEYQVYIKSDSVVFTNKAGNPLGADESQELLERLKKELTSSE